MYCNSYCSCSFEPEIIRIGQSSFKGYSNNILNCQESITILNSSTKKGLNLIECTMYANKATYHVSIKSFNCTRREVNIDLLNMKQNTRSTF